MKITCCYDCEYGPSTCPRYAVQGRTLVCKVNKSPKNYGKPYLKPVTHMDEHGNMVTELVRVVLSVNTDPNVVSKQDFEQAEREANETIDKLEEPFA